MNIVVTAHAAQRFIERINPTLTTEQARAEIASHERAIVAAANFGCRCVRLGSGAKLVLSGTSVVTVITRHSMGCSAAMPAGVRLAGHPIQFSQKGS